MNFYPPNPAFPVHHQKVRDESGPRQSNPASGPGAILSTGNPRAISYDTAYRPSPTDEDYEHMCPWPPPRRMSQHQHPQPKHQHHGEDVIGGPVEEGVLVSGVMGATSPRIVMGKPSVGCIEGVGLGTAMHAVTGER